LSTAQLSNTNKLKTKQQAVTSMIKLRKNATHNAPMHAISNTKKYRKVLCPSTMTHPHLPTL